MILIPLVTQCAVLRNGEYMCARAHTHTHIHTLMHTLKYIYVIFFLRQDSSLLSVAVINTMSKHTWGEGVSSYKLPITIHH